jgi:hypothetical protein
LTPSNTARDLRITPDARQGFAGHAASTCTSGRLIAADAAKIAPSVRKKHRHVSPTGPVRARPGRPPPHDATTGAVGVTGPVLGSIAPVVAPGFHLEDETAVVWSADLYQSDEPFTTFVDHMGTPIPTT